MKRDLKTLSGWAHAMADATEPQVTNPRSRVMLQATVYPHASERALWRQIATEIDAYLAGESAPVDEVCGQLSMIDHPDAPCPGDRTHEFRKDERPCRVCGRYLTEHGSDIA